MKRLKRLTRELKARLKEMGEDPKEWRLASELPGWYVLVKKRPLTRMTIRR